MTCIAYIFSREILAVKFYVFLVLVTVGTSKWLDFVTLFQDNARRVYDRGCGANTKFGKFSKLGLAPLLWCIIIVMLITYIHSVISGKLISIFYFPLTWSSVIWYCLCFLLFRTICHEYDSTIWDVCMVRSFSCNCWVGHVL